MTNARERWLAAAFFAAITLAFLGPGLKAGVAPVCVDALYRNPQEVPFSAVRPAGFEPHNPFLSDQALVFYPWLKFMSEAVANGELPLWSPQPAGGLPFIANLSSAFFFPTTWLSFVPWWDTGRGMFLAAIVKLFVAGFFGYLLARRLALHPIAALACGIAFELCGYNIVWLFYSLSNVSCCIPLCLWATSRFCERPDGRSIALLAGVLGLQFLGGHAETSLALALATTAYVLFRPGGETTPLKTLLPRYVAAGALALMLCAYQLLPFIEYLNLSHGKVERLATQRPEPIAAVPFTLRWLGVTLESLAGWLFVGIGAWTSSRIARQKSVVGWGWGGVALLGIGAWLLGDAVPRDRPVLMLEPNAYGSPLDGCTYDGPEAYPDVNGGYVGALVVALAAVAFLATERRRFAAWAAACVAFAWILPAQLQPFATLLKQVPPFDLAADTRMLPLSCGGLALLAALGLHELMSGHARTYARLFLALCVAVGAFAFMDSSMRVATDRSTSRVEGSQRKAKITARSDSVNIDPATYEHPIECKETAPGLPRQPTLALRGNAPPETSQVDVILGGARIASIVPPMLAADGTFGLDWNAGRIERAEYELEVNARLPAGAIRRSEPVVVDFVRTTRADLASQPRLWLVLAALLALVLGAAFLPKATPLLALACVAVIGFELFAFGANYNTYVPEAWVYPPTNITEHLRAVDAERAKNGDGPVRVHGEGLILQPNEPYAYDLQTIRSYDQLESAQFVKYMKQLTHDTSFAAWDSKSIDYRSALFRRLNVGFVISADALEASAGLERTPIHDAHGWLFRVPDALPRATVVGSAIDTHSAPVADLLAMSTRDDVAFLEEPPPQPLSGHGSVRFETYGLNEVRMSVDADGPALVVLADNFFPGWEATVNGVERRILRTHATFRAVEVSAGKSEVVMKYRPASFRHGWIAALAALAAIAALVIRGRRRTVEIA